MRATFFYKDRQENLLNELGERVFDPTEDVLTQDEDLNVALKNNNQLRILLER